MHTQKQLSLSLNYSFKNYILYHSKILFRPTNEPVCCPLQSQTHRRESVTSVCSTSTEVERETRFRRPAQPKYQRAQWTNSLQTREARYFKAKYNNAEN